MKTGTATVYRGRDRLWYWRMVASNGRTVADGAEGYSRRRTALKAFLRVRATIATARVKIAGQAAGAA